MSTSSNNLLNFLQKPSLFQGAPPKSAYRKMSSRSREKKDELWQNSSSGAPSQIQNFNTGQNFNSNANFSGAQNNGFNAGQNNQNFSAGMNFSSGPSMNSAQNFSQTQNFNSSQNYNMQPNTPDNNINYQNSNQFSTNYQNQQQFGQNDFKVEANISSPTKVNTNGFQNSYNSNSGFNTYSPNTRDNGSPSDPKASEAMKRLDILAEKVKIQVNGLNSKLQSFSAQMLSIVISEFNFVKNKVYEIIEDNFRQNQTYCKGYISKMEAEFSEEIVKARNLLLKESQNIELLKVDINKPHLSANAGYISAELQTRVNERINQVKSLEARTTPPDINLKRELLDRVILRLQRERELAFGKPI